MQIKNKNGFTLIEIMVAISILATSFVALIGSFPIGIAVNKAAEKNTIASYLAQEKIEEISSLGYNKTPVGIIEAKHQLSSDTDDYKYFYERLTQSDYVNEDLTVSVTDTSMKKITVTVFYKDSISEAEKQYTITILMIKN